MRQQQANVALALVVLARARAIFHLIRVGHQLLRVVALCCVLCPRFCFSPSGRDNRAAAASRTTLQRSSWLTSIHPPSTDRTKTQRVSTHLHHARRCCRCGEGHGPGAQGFQWHGRGPRGEARRSALRPASLGGRRLPPGKFVCVRVYVCVRSCCASIKILSHLPSIPLEWRLGFEHARHVSFVPPLACPSSLPSLPPPLLSPMLTMRHFLARHIAPLLLLTHFSLPPFIPP
jgi:hypothetical protein